jgi:hypothetical protein
VVSRHLPVGYSLFATDRRRLATDRLKAKFCKEGDRICNHLNLTIVYKSYGDFKNAGGRLIILKLISKRFRRKF